MCGMAATKPPFLRQDEVTTPEVSYRVGGTGTPDEIAGGSVIVPGPKSLPSGATQISRRAAATPPMPAASAGVPLFVSAYPFLSSRRDVRRPGHESAERSVVLFDVVLAAVSGCRFGVAY